MLSLLAAAQPGAADQTVTVTASPSVITLPSPVYVMANRDFEPLRGQYMLSDGRTLTVSGRPRRMKAQIDGLPPAELVAAVRQMEARYGRAVSRRAAQRRAPAS
jgi:hypothetical protein